MQYSLRRFGQAKAPTAPHRPKTSSYWLVSAAGQHSPPQERARLGINHPRTLLSCSEALDGDIWPEDKAQLLAGRARTTSATAGKSALACKLRKPCNARIFSGQTLRHLPQTSGPRTNMVQPDPSAACFRALKLAPAFRAARLLPTRLFHDAGRSTGETRPRCTAFHHWRSESAPHRPSRSLPRVGMLWSTSRPAHKRAPTGYVGLSQNGKRSTRKAYG